MEADGEDNLKSVRARLRSDQSFARLTVESNAANLKDWRPPLSKEEIEAAFDAACAVIDPNPEVNPQVNFALLEVAKALGALLRAGYTPDDVEKYVRILRNEGHTPDVIALYLRAVLEGAPVEGRYAERIPQRQGARGR